MKNLLLIGGGHSHVEVIRRFTRQPLEDVQLTLVNPTTLTPYSGMLPGLVAGHYSFEQCHIDLAALAKSARCRFVHSAVNGMHPDAKLAFCTNGEVLHYDIAAIDIGSTPGTLGVTGAARHALRVKPTDHFLSTWDSLITRAKRGDVPAGFSIVMAGGGAAGVEMLLSIQHRLLQAGCNSARYTIVTDGDHILQGHSQRTQRLFARVLKKRKVTVLAGQRIIRATDDAVVTDKSTRIDADLTIWATGASPAGWPRASGLAVNTQGFIRVNETLQSVNCPDIFASGDIASMEHFPRPKSGVYAVRQGPPLADNLRCAMLGQPLLPYRPQSRALALISTGDRYAVATRGWMSLGAAWVWRWKDGIDRRFMQRYRIKHAA